MCAVLLIKLVELILNINLLINYFLRSKWSFIFQFHGVQPDLEILVAASFFRTVVRFLF